MENIMPARIVAGTKFIVNGITYTAESAATPMGNGRKYRVIGVTETGTRQPIALRASDSVVSPS